MSLIAVLRLVRTCLSGHEEPVHFQRMLRRGFVPSINFLLLKTS